MVNYLYEEAPHFVTVKEDKRIIVLGSVDYLIMFTFINKNHSLDDDFQVKYTLQLFYICKRFGRGGGWFVP